MHIAFLLPSLGGGGAERTTLQFAKGMIDCGHDVTLVVADYSGPLCSEVDSRMAVRDLGTKRMSRSVVPLAKWLMKETPDYLVACQTHGNACAVYAKLLAWSRVKLVLREVSTPSINLRELSFIKRTLFRLQMIILYRLSELVVAVSKGVATDLKRMAFLPENHISVVYNPVFDNDLFMQAQLPVEHPWIKTRKFPVFVAVGRLTKAKNYPLLLRAFSLVLKTQDARLLILGEGPERTALERLIEELNLSNCVLMPGFDPNPFRYVSKADVYVMSSDWEGLPGALVQALVVGAKIVSTDCPSGPAEILEGGALGRLVPVGDMEALATAMLQALTSEAVRPPLESIKRFQQEHVVAEFESILLRRKPL